FLGMQVYWLYGRYEYSLKEREESTYNTIVAALDEYVISRWDDKSSGARVSTIRSSYNINWDTDSVGNRKVNASISWLKFNAHDILGVKEVRKLTPEEWIRVDELIAKDSTLVKAEKESYDASSSPSEAVLWGAFKRADMEKRMPLDVENLSAKLREKGVDADARLTVTDSMEWTPSFIQHADIFNPNAVVKVPYSELNRKSVIVEYHLPVATIFKDMIGSLVVVAILSVFLIVCLVYQFSTVLKLSRLDKMRNSFVTTMIHELKRPISTLKMCVSGIENEKMLADPEIKGELTSNARCALDNLSAYFSKLRDITFNNEEQIPLNITRINLYELVEEIISSMIIPVAKSVRFVNEVNTGIEISADRSHIYSIITNLVENAVKYSRDEVTITMSASISDDWVMISVADTGIGITESDMKSIFNRFYRGESFSRDVPGMGLGLTYVKLLVEAHGGDVRVDSIFGYGSTFTITLPQ
ncbi:MAG: HAMP domain-containing histidine kinase, partial [Muribaculaceae bacterium]|nr:HAMP domain-containing histidine kinase [Muribaculaceae bacterium]